MDVLAFLASLKPNGIALLAFILLDFGLGMSIGIRDGVFDWKKIADFYKTSVLPYLLGWLTFLFAYQFIVWGGATEALGEWQSVLTPIVVWGSWIFVVASLGASIIEKIKNLYKGKLIIQDHEEN